MALGAEARCHLTHDLKNGSQCLSGRMETCCTLPQRGLAAPSLQGRAVKSPGTFVTVAPGLPKQAGPTASCTPAQEPLRFGPGSPGNGGRDCRVSLAALSAYLVSMVTTPCGLHKFPPYSLDPQFRPFYAGELASNSNQDGNIPWQRLSSCH